MYRIVCNVIVVSVVELRIRVHQGFMEMIAKIIVRIHSLGINAKGNVNADLTCVITIMDVPF